MKKEVKEVKKKNSNTFAIIITVLIILGIAIVVFLTYSDVLENNNKYVPFEDATYVSTSSGIDVTYTLMGCQESVVDNYYVLNGRTVNIYYDIEVHDGFCKSEPDTDHFTISKSEYDSVNIYYRVVKETHRSCLFGGCDVAYKPIIYLYPEETQVTKVILKDNENITTSYPKYENGWNVTAEPNGNIILNGRNYYGLYYEANNNIKFNIEKDGFVVKGEEIESFLEEKLSILGLNEREANEFIIYWLPILSNNEYNYIRFATQEEIEENIPLEITPEPTTIIRVLMTYTELDKPIEVVDQELNKVERNGYTIVEWGGTKIN